MQSGDPSKTQPWTRRAKDAEESTARSPIEDKKMMVLRRKLRFSASLLSAKTRQSRDRPAPSRTGHSHHVIREMSRARRLSALRHMSVALAHAHQEFVSAMKVSVDARHDRPTHHLNGMMILQRIAKLTPIVGTGVVIEEIVKASEPRGGESGHGRAFPSPVPAIRTRGFLKTARCRHRCQCH